MSINQTTKYIHHKLGNKHKSHQKILHTIYLVDSYLFGNYVTENCDVEIDENKLISKALKRKSITSSRKCVIEYNLDKMTNSDYELIDLVKSELLSLCIDLHSSELSTKDKKKLFECMFLNLFVEEPLDSSDKIDISDQVVQKILELTTIVKNKTVKKKLQ